MFHSCIEACLFFCKNSDYHCFVNKDARESGADHCTCGVSLMEMMKHQILGMSNPFLRAKQQSGASNQQASALNPNGVRGPPGSAFPAPAAGFSQPNTAFYSNPPAGRAIPPPPTVSSMTQQMANMSLNSQAPPTSAMPPPPSGSVQGSYLPTKGRYQVPSNAYQYASASQTDSMSSPYYSAESGTSGPSTTPTYIGAGTTYDSTAPAPSATDPAALPDEEYAKLSYEIAPNSTSLQGLSGMPFGGIFRPMASDGVVLVVCSHF